MRGNAHVRFGGRAGETERSRDRHRAPVRPYYLLPPLTPNEVLEALILKDGIDAARTGPGVVYTTRLIERAAQSGLSRIASHPFYRRMTIRNWNTTRKLLAMMIEARLDV